MLWKLRALDAPITSLDSKTNTQIKAGTFNQRVRSGMVSDLFLMVVLVSESKQHGSTDTNRFLNLVFKSPRHVSNHRNCCER